MKTKLKIQPKELEYVLKKMCRMAQPKVNFKELAINQPNWFHEGSWSEDRQLVFIIWLADYLYNNNGARLVFMYYPRKSKDACLQVAQAFVFQYGWRLDL